MNLISNIWLFYKLAEEEWEPAESKREYDEFVSSGITKASYYEIPKFIKRYEDTEWFKPEDFINDLYKHWNIDYTPRTLIQAGVNKKTVIAIMNAMVDWFLKNTEELYVELYLHIESVREFISPELMNKAMKKVVLELVRSKRLNSEDEVLQDWVHLYRNTKKFSETFLEEFAKRLGVDFYVKAMKRVNRFVRQRKDILDKDKWSVYDIGVFFNEPEVLTGRYGGNGAFDQANIELMIHKADQEAKEYMRGFLYMDKAGDLFILDNEMQPMNNLYKKEPWPKYFVPVRLGKISKYLQGVWQEIFDAFEIIPQ